MAKRLSQARGLTSPATRRGGFAALLSIWQERNGTLTQPKITIVVPTRERLPVLRDMLRTLLSQQYDRLEILVSDNASQDGTGDFVRSLDDPRLRYVNTGRRLSMTANWEFALSHVMDGWVTFVGDDDGLMPGAVARIAELIASTDCAAITYRACNYIWPGNGTPGRLNVPLVSGREERSAAEWLQRVIKARSDYSELPNIYTVGIVKVRAMREAMAGGDTFFRSSIPDIYASIAIARVIPSFLVVDEVLAIIGNSRFSNGAAFVRSLTSSEAKGEFERFMSEASIPVHAAIPVMRNGTAPPFWQMYIYECYLQSDFLPPSAVPPTAAGQLALALAAPYDGAQQDQVTEWATAFASLHGVDLAEARREAENLRRRRSWRMMGRLARGAFSTVMVSDAKLPISNVAEAAIFASAILWSPPALPTRLGAIARRVSARRRQSPAATRAAAGNRSGV